MLLCAQRERWTLPKELLLVILQHLAGMWIRKEVEQKAKEEKEKKKVEQLEKPKAKEKPKGTTKAEPDKKL